MFLGVTDDETAQVVWDGGCMCWRSGRRSCESQAVHARMLQVGCQCICFLRYMVHPRRYISSELYRMRCLQE